MKILQRYILGEFLRAFFLSMGVILSIVVVVNCIVFLHRHGLELGQVLKVIPLILPYTLSYMISISLISACAVTYGRFAHDGELDVIAASGIHLHVVITPILLFSLALSGFCVWINFAVAPVSARKQALFLKDALQDLLILKLSLGQKDIDLDNGHLTISYVDDGTFYGVSFVTLDEFRRPDKIISAKECHLNYDEARSEIQLKFIGSSGYLFNYDGEDTVLEKIVAEESLQSFDLSSLQKAEKRVSSFSYADLVQREQELFYLNQIFERSDSEIETDRNRFAHAESLTDATEKIIAPGLIREIRTEQQYRLLAEEAQDQEADLQRLQALENPASIEEEEISLLQNTLNEFERKTDHRRGIKKKWLKEYHKVRAESKFRMAAGFAPFFLALLAIPLSILLQHPNRIVSFFYCALPVFLLYYPATITGQAMAVKGLVDPLVIWSANGLLLVAGGLLLRKVLAR